MLKRLMSSVAGGASRAARLENRGALRVSGPDAGRFLQGLVTNDVVGEAHPLTPVLYAHMLNAKGRIWFDLMIYPSHTHNGKDQDYVVEVDQSQLPDFKSTLTKYKMRSDVELTENKNEWQIWTVKGCVDPSNLNVDVPCRFGPDPRLAGFHRVALKSSDAPPLTVDESLVTDYREERYSHGLCEGTDEFVANDCLPLEHNLDLYDGVCFNKGCYIGQELTTRTHFTGVVRKRALPVRLVSGPGGELPTAVVQYKNSSGQLKRAGRVRAWSGDHGIAVLPVDYLSAAPELTIKREDSEVSVIEVSELSPVLADGIANSLKQSPSNS